MARVLRSWLTAGSRRRPEHPARPEGVILRMAHTAQSVRSSTTRRRPQQGQTPRSRSLVRRALERSEAFQAHSGHRARPGQDVRPHRTHRPILRRRA